MNRRGKCTRQQVQQVVLDINSNGEIRFLFSDTLSSLLHLGDATIRRASYVEPIGTEWNADLSPVNGPILGPFALRLEALAAEAAWLLAHGIPTPHASN